MHIKNAKSTSSLSGKTGVIKAPASAEDEPFEWILEVEARVCTENR